jgi:hypothetical protein
VDNPFERYDLDPREGIAAITQRLKELAEDATDDAERERIRAAWEELTLHPARRLRAALFAHPETRKPLGNPPPLQSAHAAPVELGLRDLAARPTISAVMSLSADAEPDAPPLDDDPILRSAARR